MRTVDCMDGLETHAVSPNSTLAMDAVAPGHAGETSDPMANPSSDRDVATDWGWDPSEESCEDAQYRKMANGNDESAANCIAQMCEALLRGAKLVRGKDPAKASLFVRGVKILKRRSVASYSKPLSIMLTLTFLIGAFIPLINADAEASSDIDRLAQNLDSEAVSPAGAYDDFATTTRSANLTVTTGSSLISVWTEEYVLKVEYKTNFVNYTIQPYFSSDFVWYRRSDGYYEPGTYDEKVTDLDGVKMTISNWGRNGNVVWFNESCPEFSLIQSFNFFRDYFELNVTYHPGTKKVLTTYFIALCDSQKQPYSMISSGHYYRYIPGVPENTPSSNAIGGWYPCGYFAPVVDMRAHQGSSLGLEWGYNETVAYVQSPQYMALNNPFHGGTSVFGLKFTSTNSVVPNVSLGKSKTFHMFVRPYQYTDGKDRGYDVGYAQWVSPKIASYWGNHNTQSFPLTVMNLGAWTTEFKNWVESSQVKVATYSENPDQIDWNYKSSSVPNLQDPTPARVPNAWEVWNSSHQPYLTNEGEVKWASPVSGPYTSPGTFRWHLIQNDSYMAWWTGTQGVFWDMMDSWDAYTRPRNDYQNRDQFIYEGYLNLVKDSYASYWDYVISNTFYGSIHMAIASDLTCVEGYEITSIYGTEMKSRAISLMNFVNNIPSEYRPQILVYQYYSSTSTKWRDHNSAYSALFGSARYKFHIDLYSYSSYSSQLHFLQMAEDMFEAMGCTRNSNVRIPVGTLDLTSEGSSLTTAARMVVTNGSGSPTITFTAASDMYTITNLNATSNNFNFVIPSDYYYDAGSNVERTSPMTFSTDGKGTFHGKIAAEKTGDVVRRSNLRVSHAGTGTATVNLISSSSTAAELSVAATGGSTTISIGGLVTGQSYAIYVSSEYIESKVADSQGFITFTRSYDSSDTVIIQQDSEGDTIPPSVVSSVPTNGATDIEPTQEVEITFSETMDRSATGSAFSMTKLGAVVPGSIAWESSDTKLIFSPSQVLEYDTKYYANLGTSTRDISGNQLQSAYSISFTTKDTYDSTAPTVSDVIPASGATGVSVHPIITITFSEPMNVSSTSSSIHLSSSEGGVDGYVQWTGSNTTATFTPSEELMSLKTYTITVEETAEDLFDNNLASTFTSTFVTEDNDADTTSPSVISVTPPDGSTNVDVAQDVVIYFDEAMNKSSVESALSVTHDGQGIGGSISWDANGTTLVFTPFGLLPYSSTIIVTIQATAKDLAGNALVSAYTYSFSTVGSEDSTEPTVTGIQPSDGEDEVSNYATIVIDFSEQMNVTATSGALSISSVYGPVVGSIQWTDKDTSLVFTPSSPLLPFTEYTVRVGTTAADLAGICMSSEFVSIFSTQSEDADTSAPLIEHVRSGNAEVGSPLRLTANVTDVSKLASVTLSYIDVTGSYHSTAMGMNLGYFDATVPAQATPGTVRYTIQAQDEFGNIATTDEYALGVYDTTIPTIRIVSPSDGLELNSLTNIETVANDNYGISSVEFSVDGTVTMNDTTEPYVFVLNPSTLENGSHAIDVTAYDLSGMRVSASVSIEVRRIDVQPPMLQIVYPSDGLTGVDVSVDIYVRFSEAMDPSSTVSAISLETGGTWVDLVRTWQDDSSLKVNSVDGLSYATDYTLHVNASAMDRAGNTLLGSLEFIFRTQPKDGLQTVSGFVMTDSAPLSDAVVTDGSRSVRTDAYGVFVFSDVSPGSYSLSASKWNYSCEKLVRVTLYGGESVSGIEFTAVPSAGVSSITGVVVDNSSSPVRGAAITVEGTLLSAFSDANGRFILTNVTPGTYTIRVSRLLYETETITGVVVSQGEDAETLSIAVHSNYGSSTTDSTTPGAIAISDLALPFMVGAGIAALAGGMVMRKPLRSDRKGPFGNGKVSREQMRQNMNGTLDEQPIAARVGKNVSTDGDQRALDSLVELLSSDKPAMTKKVISKVDADGEEDFSRGLKELEKLK